MEEFMQNYLRFLTFYQFGVRIWDRYRLTGSKTPLDAFLEKHFLIRQIYF